MGGNYLLRHVAWHSDIHPELWPDHELVRLGVDILHSWRVAVDLVRAVRHILCRLSRGPEIHKRGGEAIGGAVLWASHTCLEKS